MKNYFVYDGSAEIDIDDACVLECFEAKNNKDAVKYYFRNYKGVDSILCDSEDTVMRVMK